MKEENAVKGLIALVFAGAGAYFRELLGPVIVLGLVMLADYISGLARAWIEKTLSSRVGIIGVIKKIAYLLAVAVAIVVDWTIQTAAAKTGLEVGNFYMFGLLVTFWLVLNECINKNMNTPGAGWGVTAILGDFHKGPGRIIVALSLKPARRNWGVGPGRVGSYNNTRVQWEICEPSGHTYAGGTMIGYDPEKNAEYFRRMWSLLVKWNVYICMEYGLTAADICDHAEAHAAGMGSNHGDIANESMAQEINVLIVEAGKAPRPAKVLNTMETFAEIVGGPVEAGCYLPQRVMLIRNENSKALGLPPNRANPHGRDYIAGTFLLCGFEGDSFTSLTSAQQVEFQ